MREVTIDNHTINMGFTSDSNASVLYFPVTEFFEKFGLGGTFAVLNRRPTEKFAYSIPLSQISLNGEVLQVLLSEYDTAIASTQREKGEIELAYSIDNVRKMSQVWYTEVNQSLVDSGVIPTPYETWLDALEDKAARAETAELGAEQAKAAAAEFASFIENMNISVRSLPSTESATVEKTMDPTTGGWLFKMGIPRGADGGISIVIVQVLPETGASNTIYLVPSSDPKTGDLYEEYIFTNGKWERIGGTSINLNDYLKKSEAQDTYQKIENVDTFVAQYGVTTFAEISNAAKARKSVTCLYQDGSTGYRSYILVNITGASATFSVPFDNDSLGNAQFRTIQVNASGWLQPDNRKIEKQSNRENTLSNSTTKYPTSHAVHEAIAALDQKFVKNHEQSGDEASFIDFDSSRVEIWSKNDDSDYSSVYIDGATVEIANYFEGKESIIDVNDEGVKVRGESIKLSGLDVLVESDAIDIRTMSGGLDLSAAAGDVNIGTAWGDINLSPSGVANYNGEEIAVKSDIPDVPEDKVFVATYGTTTLNEVASAISDRKIVICIYSNWVYRAVNSDRFESFDATSGIVRYLKIAANNTWSSGSTNIERTSYKVTFLTSASTDAQYPSAKCVYDTLQNAVGDVHAALQELLGGETEANA